MKLINFFFDKDWLVKSYYKHLERFKDEFYWDCVGTLPDEKAMCIETEGFDRMFHSVLPFRDGLIFGFVSDLSGT